MNKGISRLILAIFGGFSSLAAALALPVLFQRATTFAPSLAQFNPYLIASTMAQTAPQTLDEITTAVTNSATSFLPGYLLYAVFGLIVVLAIFLISRLISGLRRG